MSGYAVLDFETTGLMPEKQDRVVEVGVVLTDDRGQIENEWTTLINPKRDLGPTHIHGITAAQVMGAPEFEEIAAYLLELLRGRTVVAHNASFDMRFLHHELVRSGYPMLTRPTALCTMRWAGPMIGAAKLAHCCEALGIELAEAHTALADARATARLLEQLFQRAGHQDDWNRDVQRSATFPWPEGAPACAFTSISRTAIQPVHDWWLGRILEATWIPGDPPEASAYLLCLENALLDRSISLSEGAMLLLAAEEGGLDAARVDQLHREYLHALASEAWADGVVTDVEREELAAIASALRLSPEDVDKAVSAAKSTSVEGRPTEESFLRPGDRVVFTGALSRERDDWIADIVSAGLASGGITKSTRVVVTSDPDSMSSKAMKARNYGVPLINEGTFQKMFDSYRGIAD